VAAGVSVVDERSGASPDPGSGSQNRAKREYNILIRTDAGAGRHASWSMPRRVSVLRAEVGLPPTLICR
jgi:hypothetical protein